MQEFHTRTFVSDVVLLHCLEGMSSAHKELVIVWQMDNTWIQPQQQQTCHLQENYLRHPQTTCLNKHLCKSTQFKEGQNLGPNLLVVLVYKNSKTNHSRHQESSIWFRIARMVVVVFLGLSMSMPCVSMTRARLIQLNLKRGDYTYFNTPEIRTSPVNILQVNMKPTGTTYYIGGGNKYTRHL